MSSIPDRSSLKPLTVWWRPITPNPAKVIIILEELKLPYKGTFVELEDLKKEPFESVNPNGRVPAIHDPNTNITLWESNAIIQYLIDTYDTNNTLTYTSTPEKYHLIQWEHFQASGQGPYWGQATWFLLYHPEPVESAKERYLVETRRVAGVIDKWLAARAAAPTSDDAEAKASGLAGPAKDADGNVWLVGNKMTWVDLVFSTWNAGIGMGIQYSGRGKEDWDPETMFPHFWKWHSAMASRPSFQKALSLQKPEDVHS